jgi:hypothetical protein
MMFNLKNLYFVFLSSLTIVACTNKESDPPSSTDGSIIFWTPNLEAHGGYVDVTINGLTRQITTNWTAAPPNCLSTNGVAYFNFDAGQYSYTTIDYFGFTSNGTVTVVANDCNKNRRVIYK